MKKLSFKEWLAVAASVAFVSYMLFGNTLVSVFKNNIPILSQNSLSNTASLEMNSGLNVKITDLVIGKGKNIDPGALVSVNYILKLQDGTVIQDSKTINNNQPFQFIFGSGQLIPGWEMGISGMKVGGKRIVVIPPELGYGSQQVGPIPANSILVFEIEIVDTEIISR